MHGISRNVFHEKWGYIAVVILLVMYMFEIVTKSTIFAFYSRDPFESQVIITTSLLFLFLYCSYFTSKAMRPIVSYNDTSSTSDNKINNWELKNDLHRSVSDIVLTQLPQLLDDVVSASFPVYGIQNSDGTVLPGTLKVISISSESESDLFVELELNGKIRGALDKLKWVDWTLQLNSFMKIPSFMRAHWRSKDGRNGIVIVIHPDVIDFTKTYQFPSLFDPIDTLKKPLDVFLWKDEKWNDVVVDIASTPHLLVAWTTGKWKSVWVTNIIISLLKNIEAGAPIESIYLVDPKFVEFGMYRWLNWVQYCDDLKYAVQIFSQMVEEMEKRYKMIQNANVKNIEWYRQKGYDMGYVVLIVDEFADFVCWDKELVMQFETSVQRLAQKWRACGIHMILATQRPSVDVIKPVIRSNIPSRIWFWTANWSDSGIIIWDSMLAQLPRWEAYIMINSEPKHIKTYFISESDIEEFIAQYKRKTNTEAIKEAFNFDKFFNFLKEKWIVPPLPHDPSIILLRYIIDNSWYKNREILFDQVRKYATRDQVRSLINHLKKSNVISNSANQTFNRLTIQDIEENMEDTKMLYEIITEWLVWNFAE